MANRKAFHVNVALPCILKPLDAIGGKDEINVKRSFLQFNKILPSLNLCGLGIGDDEAKFGKCGDDGPPVFRRLLREEIHILRRIGEPQKNRAGLSNEEIATA